MFKICFVSLALAFQQSPAPDIMLPETVKAQVGVFVPITAQTKGDTVRFVAIDPGLSVFPANLLADKKSTVVVASRDGTYRILAYTSVDNQPSSPAFCTIVVGDGKNPDNNKPDNNKPDNNKPDNNKPDPVVNDPLLDSLKGVYGGLQESDKAESVKNLIQTYELAVIEANNPNYKTLSQLYVAIKSLSVQSLKGDKISPIRDMLADELDSKIGTDPNIVLNDDIRKKCKEQFVRMAKLLGGLK